MLLQWGQYTRNARIVKGFRAREYRPGQPHHLVLKIALLFPWTTAQSRASA
jgi:hypothetical protein